MFQRVTRIANLTVFSLPAKFIVCCRTKAIPIIAVRDLIAVTYNFGWARQPIRMKCNANKRSCTPNLSKPFQQKNTPQDDWTEAVVCKTTDLKENEMKIVKIGDDLEVLLIKQHGEFSALGTKCTHFGAVLDKGALAEGKIRCQWHNACFNVKTGDIEDYPGLDSLPCYKVTVKGDNVLVAVKKTEVKLTKREKVFTRRSKDDPTTFVIVGGGPAGVTCAQTLRENGFKGRLLLISSEHHLPYDRIKLSKVLDITHDKILFKPESFYNERDIELKLGVKLDKIIPKQKHLSLSDGETVKYDKVFLATGARALRLTTPGADLRNIFTIRNIEDTNIIHKTLISKSEVVVLGASFIGLEIAAAAKAIGKNVTVVALDTVPFQFIFGEKIGKRVMKMYEDEGVKFELKESVVEFRGTDGDLSSVVLKSGKVLKAGICIMGVGVRANTDYLQSTGVTFQRDGSIEVDEHLKTSFDSVYAGGDVAYAPVLGKNATIGHLQLAHYHGRIAALNMAGKETKLNAVPFFWATLFGTGLRYCGYSFKYTRLEIRGDIDQLAFVAFYIMDNDEIGAVLTCKKDPIAAHFGNLLEKGDRLQVSQIDTWLANN